MLGRSIFPLRSHYLGMLWDSALVHYWDSSFLCRHSELVRYKSFPWADSTSQSTSYMVSSLSSKKSHAYMLFSRWCWVVLPWRRVWGNTMRSFSCHLITSVLDFELFRDVVISKDVWEDLGCSSVCRVLPSVTIGLSAKTRGMAHRAA